MKETWRTQKEVYATSYLVEPTIRGDEDRNNDAPVELQLSELSTGKGGYEREGAELREPAEVGQTVMFVEKPRGPFLTGLHDVQRNAVEVNSRTPAHAVRTVKIEPGPCRK